MVTARTPIRSAAAIWLRINASKGEMSKAGPLHNQQAAKAFDNVANRIFLSFAEVGIREIGTKSKKLYCSVFIEGHLLPQ
jgi:hypothetical protein